MGGWEDDAYDAEQDEAREEFIKETLKGISDDGVRGYLGCYGDAIDQRVQNCIRQAGELTAGGYFQPAVVLATTAIELTVRYFLIHPLIQAAFLSEEWAYLLTQRVAAGRTAEDRKLLPKILEFHNIKLCELKLKSEALLWDVVTSKVYPKRHRIVHQGELASKEDAELALECAARLRSDVVLPLSKVYGFTLETTGRWNTRRLGVYGGKDPFTRE